MSTAFDLENDKLTLSKDGLRYTLPYEADSNKCIMASNHFCTLSTLQFHTHIHILFALAFVLTQWHSSIL